MYSDAGEAVVQIEVRGKYRTPVDGTVEFARKGTGFLVSPDGYVLTAGYVVPEESLFVPNSLVIHARRPRIVDEALVAQDLEALHVIQRATTPEAVAVLKLSSVDAPMPYAKAMPYLRLCDGIEIGDQVSVLGYSGGLTTLSRTVGKASSPPDHGSLLLQIRLSPEDSGAPVFNTSGMVFGIVTGPIANQGRPADTSAATVMAQALAGISDTVAIGYDSDRSRQVDKPIQFRIVNDEWYTYADNWSEVMTQHHYLQQVGYLYIEATIAIIGIYTTPQLYPNEPSTIAPNFTVDHAKVTITSRGTYLYYDMAVRATDNGPRFGWVLHRTSMQLQAEEPPIVASVHAEPEVRSFPVSRTHSVHRDNPFQQRFVDRIPAPTGYRFVAAIGVSNVALSHSPSNGAVASIEGGTLVIRYTLESGPAGNPYDAWIDAIAFAKLRPQ